MSAKLGNFNWLEPPADEQMAKYQAAILSVVGNFFDAVKLAVKAGDHAAVDSLRRSANVFCDEAEQELRRGKSVH